jgi:hypothetical protein
MPYARHTRSARPELIFLDTGTASFSSLFSLLQLSLRLQGRAFGAPGLTAPGREQCGRARAVERERAARVTRRRRLRFTRGLAVAGRQLFAASFGRKPYGAAAAAHGTPVTRRLRFPPYPAAAPTAPRPNRHPRARCADRRENVTVTGAERRALSGSASPASTVLRIPLRGTRLRRAVDPGDLCRPSGPDGEGQARGQARRRAANT